MAAVTSVRESSQYKWYALAAVMLGTLMAPLDSSIANVALPTIGRAFHTSVDTTEWVLLSYMLTTSSSLVLFGRLGDMWGQKRVYGAGFAVFGLSSLACAFAPSFFVLVAARAVQGLGAAMLMSSSPAIITNAFPSKERGRAIGLNGAAVAVGLSLGPVLGGVIVTWWHWSWIFLINVPISILALAASTIVLRHEKQHGESFDFAGAGLAFAALFSLALALSRAHVWGWTSVTTIGTLVFAILALWAFFVVECRVKAPIIDFDLFKNQTFAFSVLALLIYFIAIYSLIFTVPLAAQVALGDNGLRAGLLVLPVTALNIVLAPVAGALSDRIAAKYISTFGAALVFIGALLLAFQGPHPASAFLLAALFVAGAGTAVFSQPNNSTIMGAAPPNRRGIAAGVLATARTTGQLLGISIAGAIYFLRSAQLGAQSHTFQPAEAVFLAVAIIMVPAMLVSYFRD